MLDYLREDTICAIATPPGKGPIALVRISGRNALQIVNKLLSKPLGENQIRIPLLRKIYQEDGKLLDEVIVTYFKSPSSYSGEDMVEISCHGSPYIQNKIIELLLKEGAKYAFPGEFTFRAFLNKKLDLTKAESINNLINAYTEKQHHLAISMYSGGLSNAIKNLRNMLLELLTYLELDIDFSDQDIEPLSHKQVISILFNVAKEITNMLSKYKIGTAIQEGIPISIVGEPNVGKSTLLNTILGEEKAIVTPIPGTTRDIIEASFQWKGILFRVLDTAGLRDTTDIIEQIGIEKTISAIKKSLIILLVYDLSNYTEENVNKTLEFIKNINKESIIILVANKVDIAKKAPLNFHTSVSISAKQNININGLLDHIYESFIQKYGEIENTIGINARHKMVLEESFQLIQNTIKKVENNIPLDMLMVDIKEISNKLAEITGDISNDEIFNNIFTNFCIGK